MFKLFLQRRGTDNKLKRQANLYVCKSFPIAFFKYYSSGGGGGGGRRCPWDGWRGDWLSVGRFNWQQCHPRDLILSRSYSRVFSILFYIVPCKGVEDWLWPRGTFADSVHTKNSLWEAIYQYGVLITPRHASLYYIIEPNPASVQPCVMWTHGVSLASGGW